MLSQMIISLSFFEIYAHRSAAFKGNLRRLREFLQKDRSLCNAQDIKGNTPLMFAAMADKLDAMSDLLHAGGDLNIKNKSGV